MTDEFCSGKLLINDVRQSLVSLALSKVLIRGQPSQREGEVSVTYRGGNRAAVTTMQSQSLIYTGDDKSFVIERLQQDCPYLPPNLPHAKNCSRLI